MLYADLNKFRRTFPENEVMREALDFIVNEAAGLDDGRYDLPGGLYAVIMHYAPTKPVNRRYETHVKYHDVQAVLEGDEFLLYHPLIGDMGVTEDRLEKDDIRFHSDPPLGMEVALRLRPGYFVVLTPEDAHKTECLGGSAHVRKCVVKVPVDAAAL